MHLCIPLGELFQFRGQRTRAADADGVLVIQKPARAHEVLHALVGDMPADGKEQRFARIFAAQFLRARSDFIVNRNARLVCTAGNDHALLAHALKLRAALDIVGAGRDHLDGAMQQPSALPREELTQHLLLGDVQMPPDDQLTGGIFFQLFLEIICLKGIGAMKDDDVGLKLAEGLF